MVAEHFSYEFGATASAGVPVGLMAKPTCAARLRRMANQPKNRDDSAA
jgi:hypothetical protein